MCIYHTHTHMNEARLQLNFIYIYIYIYNVYMRLGNKAWRAPHYTQAMCVCVWVCCVCTKQARLQYNTHGVKYTTLHIYIYIYIYIYVCMYVCIYIYIYAYIYMHIYILWVYVCVYVYVCTYSNIDTHYNQTSLIYMLG
jgi:hypothetical protein